MNSIREQLKSYLDGELSPQDARQVERAMEADPELKQEFEELRRISATLREASIAPKAVGLESTLAALQRGARPVRRPLRWGPALALAGACSVALLVVARNGGTFLANSDEEGPQPIEKTAQPVMSAGRVSAAESAPVRAYIGQQPNPKPMDRAKPAAAIVKALGLELSVPDVAEAQRTAERLASQSGGFVLAKSLSKAGTDASGSLYLLIPDRRIETTLVELRKLGTVTKERSEEADSNLNAGAPTRDQVVRELKLAPGAQMATLRISFSQSSAKPTGMRSGGWVEGTLASATASLFAVCRVLGQFLIYALVLTPIWLPLTLLVRWIGSRQQLTA